ncbi:uncharacterized protein LOC115643794 [Gopherus evgoodei]|uniref:uncharacterized protein LOC115643794 n=1 Tax=Gopherus evgoodei TaxID=1825980 RepID=UPI0011D0221F|nr:uncharacterized protein LOC115643794 [Gopherus evgoodei]
MGSCGGSAWDSSTQRLPAHPAYELQLPRLPAAPIACRELEGGAAAGPERDAAGVVAEAGERALQRFYAHRVFVQGEGEDWRAGSSSEVLSKAVAKLIEWLYPEDARPVGSHEQELHVQSRASAFHFLIPLRFPPELRLMGRRPVRDPSALETRLPTYICGAGRGAAGVPLRERSGAGAGHAASGGGHRLLRCAQGSGERQIQGLICCAL